ncbi:type II toxin-antitoxin system RelE family toxin [Testudinibacter sp. TR-2022]|uniref:type II toxin-antitoxin system RelE family toxin n=1 Tax=Testudinibacter sp. TR-2022 TaxID=2585029 RepID=UPI0011180672|nr:type II toxin-antitoxin system RelE/ParE family toxin [Testudinibacter sp. TR-2022]TNH07027.1 type II toxin-antitoxin system RelE/ParE family toxin [Pasteurellaceae bacterium Phil11]TNH21779.1 type II toxin-antitoxin system RelE/ParE family toxin [Testudinibacter sp. TR-2022]TNH29081.1 type II toxin-antitoxin system RelE/ParE family toxin [Testudinibacter sp. TR-2022]
MNRIEWTMKAVKQLLKIDTRYVKAIKDSVAELAEFPLLSLDIKKLQGLENQYRIRVGKYRVIFDVVNGEPRIISIKAIKRRTDQTYN